MNDKETVKAMLSQMEEALDSNGFDEDNLSLWEAWEQLEFVMGDRERLNKESPMIE